jgi:hypothetical protein
MREAGRDKKRSRLEKAPEKPNKHMIAFLNNEDS